MKKGSQRTVEERRELTIMFEFLGMDANGVSFSKGWRYIPFAHFCFMGIRWGVKRRRLLFSVLSLRIGSFGAFFFLARKSMDVRHESA